MGGAGVLKDMEVGGGADRGGGGEVLVSGAGVLMEVDVAGGRASSAMEAIGRTYVWNWGRDAVLSCVTRRKTKVKKRLKR